MRVMDNLKNELDDIGDMADAMRERLQLLKNKEKNGTLSDSDRSELQQLKERLNC